MSEPVRRRATYQDVLDAPPEKIAEVIDDELYLSRPGLQQSAITAALSGLLGPPFHLGIDAPGTWTLLYAPELHLGDDIVVPSLAGWHRERMPVADETPFETSAPDWICEVLSASAEPLDRRAKMPIYASHGVTHAWLAHPAQRTVEIFWLQGRTWRRIATHHGADRVRIEPFEAIELDLSMVWEMLGPPSPDVRAVQDVPP